MIALGGVVLGLIARDLWMATYLARRKPADELTDRKESEGKAHRDLVRLYADPLHEAVKTLGFRRYHGGRRLDLEGSLAVRFREPAGVF